MLKLKIEMVFVGFVIGIIIYMYFLYLYIRIFSLVPVKYLQFFTTQYFFFKLDMFFVFLCFWCFHSIILVYYKLIQFFLLSENRQQTGVISSIGSISSIDDHWRHRSVWNVWHYYRYWKSELRNIRKFRTIGLNAFTLFMRSYRKRQHKIHKIRHFFFKMQVYTIFKMHFLNYVCVWVFVCICMRILGILCMQSDEVQFFCFSWNLTWLILVKRNDFSYK